jgi:hypothetical protein
MGTKFVTVNHASAVGRWADGAGGNPMQVNEGLWIGSRRDILGGAAKLAVGGTLAAALARRGLGQALAQSTPAASSYPELTVTITDQALQVSAEQIPAGYVLLTAINKGTGEGGVGLIGPGPGKTMQDLQQAAATPAPEDSLLPPFFYSATIPGGPGTIPENATAQTVIEIAAGDWAVFGFSEASNPEPVFITATAATPTAQTPPAAAVTITEVDFAFGGFGETIAAGQQTWKVTNQGTQPHMLSLSQVPAGTTIDQVLASVNQTENATPAPGLLGREDFKDVGGVALQSPGTTVWPMLDLPAGRYVALCFVGDPVHGDEPHVMEGMAAVFDGGALTTSPDPRGPTAAAIRRRGTGRGDGVELQSPKA